jgi:molybdopterin-containing oxidoreductase family iron-sulfur binding subunit
MPQIFRPRANGIARLISPVVHHRRHRGHDLYPEIDLAALRQSLAEADGKAFWRALDELAGTPEFVAYLHNEFPRLAPILSGATDRRSALKLLGASLALGGLAGCEAPEYIVPYVQQPEHEVPGRPRYYATALTIDGYGFGALVESQLIDRVSLRNPTLLD